MTTLENSFHNTSVRTHASVEKLEEIKNKSSWDRTPLERALVSRLRNALCGSNDCTCATDIFGGRYDR